jgi:hypothetical protein
VGIKQTDEAGDIQCEVALIHVIISRTLLPFQGGSCGRSRRRQKLLIPTSTPYRRGRRGSLFWKTRNCKVASSPFFRCGRADRLTGFASRVNAGRAGLTRGGRKR